MDTMVVNKSKGVVKIHIISTETEFQSLRNEWNRVLLEIGECNPFLTHEWLFSWWKNYSSDKKLMILKFTRESEVIGFVPLMKYTTALTGISFQAVGFLSNHWTRMNFIFASQVEECLRSLAAYIKESKETFIFAQMDQGHEIHQLFCRILKEERLSHALQSKPHAYVELKGTWEDYFNKQSRNFRMDSRRKLKRLEKEGDVVLERSKGERSDQVINQLKSIAQNCWQAKDNVNIVSTEEGFRFYEEICASRLKGSILDFSILTVKDKPIAYMVGLIKGDCYFAFDTAYDKSYEQFSPGLILHNLLIEELYKYQIKIFDFGYSASYKKRWSSETLLVGDVVIFAKGFQGMLLKFGHLLKSLRNRSSKKEKMND